MDIILSHTSALEVIRWANFPHILEARGSCTPTVPDRMPTSEELKDARRRCRQVEVATTPIHLLVSKKGACHASEEIRAHLLGTDVPEDSFVRIARGVYCTKPALLVVQMAQFCNHLELVCLLGELLGTYAINPAAKRGMIQREKPILTVDELEEYLDELGNYRGVAKVRRALAEVMPFAASPMETKLTIRVRRRYSAGGYNIDVKAMNESLVMERVIGAIVRDGVRKPDLLLTGPAENASQDAGSSAAEAPERAMPFWGVALDYNGNGHAERQDEDARRNNELLAYGLKGYAISKAEYDNLTYMDWLIDVVIRRDLALPKRRVTEEQRVRERKARQLLWEELEKIDGFHWTGLT